jgi:hypothetical protein
MPADDLMTSLAQAAERKSFGDSACPGIGDDGIAGIGAAPRRGRQRHCAGSQDLSLQRYDSYRAAERYGLPDGAAGVTMAETIRTHCLDTSH